MDEKALQQYLLTQFPKENAACEWKEFKNLRHALMGAEGSPDDLKGLVLDKLSDALDEKQKQDKFRNLLYALSKRDQAIEKQGSKQKGRWVLVRLDSDKIQTRFSQTGAV